MQNVTIYIRQYRNGKQQYVRADKDTPLVSRYTIPSFITKSTFAVARISASGSPGIATMSASLPGASTPRSSRPRSSAAVLVAACKARTGLNPAFTIA